MSDRDMSLSRKCPICMHDIPCPTEFGCIYRWGHILLDWLDDEENDRGQRNES
jgi:hypothetical protein